MNEKQLLDRLKREADTVPLPETLSPEAIERMLLAAQKNQAAPVSYTHLTLPTMEAV